MFRDPKFSSLKIQIEFIKTEEHFKKKRGKNITNNKKK